MTTTPTSRDFGLRQLTIDGREVSHPPPRPKAKCPECAKLVTLNDGGELRHHTNGWGEICPMAGQHLPR
jgi:hypothetical protein